VRTIGSKPVLSSTTPPVIMLCSSSSSSSSSSIVVEFVELELFELLVELLDVLEIVTLG